MSWAHFASGAGGSFCWVSAAAPAIGAAIARFRLERLDQCAQLEPGSPVTHAAAPVENRKTLHFGGLRAHPLHLYGVIWSGESSQFSAVLTAPYRPWVASGVPVHQRENSGLEPGFCRDQEPRRRRGGASNWARGHRTSLRRERERACSSL